jgi:CubicO group peptidase (beta-lactamase class C family)
MIRRVVLASVFVAATAGAQQGHPDSVFHWIDSVFAPYASRNSPGCAVGVSRDGALVFAKGYGEADLAQKAPIGADTRFYIASLSKQFTAMSVLLLEQDHRLSLDDTIRKWVPEVPAFGKPITLRQLLHHTSGLRDYFTLLAVSGWSSDGELTEKRFLELIGRQKSLNFAPGDEFLYSNTGYALLSIVVKRASGKSLRDFAAERIFAPLGMTHTEFRDDHRLVIPNVALGYQADDDGYRVSQPSFDVVGDGGVYSTIGDLAKWDANFTTGTVGGSAAVAELETPGRLNNGQEIPYALALSIGTWNGMKTVSHSGAYGGYRSEFVRFPDKHITVTTLCNTSTAQSTLAEQVGMLVIGTLPARTTAATLDLSAAPFSIGGSHPAIDSTGARRRNDQLAQLAGPYYSEELDLPVTLVVRDGVVLMQRPHSGDIRFVALSKDLFSSNEHILLQVVRDSHDAVSAFTLTITRARGLEFYRRDVDFGVGGSNIGPHDRQ